MSLIKNCRFDNEAQAVRCARGTVVEVVRRGFDYGGHGSEQGVSPELSSTRIYNNGNLDDLRTTVANILSGLTL